MSLGIDVSTPLPFGDLIKMVHSEEARREERQVRFGSASKSHCHAAVGGDFSSDLERKVQQLELQVKGLLSKKADPQPVKKTSDMLSEQVTQLQLMIGELMKECKSNRKSPNVSWCQREFPSICKSNPTSKPKNNKEGSFEVSATNLL